MKIYFAGSIRGGRGDVELYHGVIDYLKSKGKVLTEHIGEKNISSQGEDKNSDKFIHDRDMEWISEADYVVAEVTTPSLGVGYEIGRALGKGKKILCIYRKQKEKKLSAMISGCSDLVVREYENLGKVKNRPVAF
jgi:2'-deoxynucleoside 5'-phosphate N-hydrolase